MLLLIGGLVIGTIINLVSAMWTQIAVIRLMSGPYDALPDLIHLTTPAIDTFIPDYFLGASTLYAITCYDNLENVEKNLTVLVICIYLRSITMFLTMMPTCMPERDPTQGSFYGSLFHTTHDLMFSGHSLCFFYIGSITNTPVIYFVGPFLLIVARQHYTIDVLVSALVYNYVYLLV